MQSGTFLTSILGAQDILLHGCDIVFQADLISIDTVISYFFLASEQESCRALIRLPHILFFLCVQTQ